jgi:adenylate kinase
MAPKHLVFLGPPGTGKGTQAARLQERYGWKTLSSGDVMRAEMQARSPLGLAAAEYYDQGRLVPDDIITGVILSAVEKLGRETGWVLDGFPRTVPQAQSLEARQKDWGFGIDAVINFGLADETILERIVSRRVCKKCGATYNVRFQPPSRPGVCDRCGGEVVQRKDDDQQVVQTRLKAYREQTAPLIEYYTTRGLLHTVDAAASVDVVGAEVERIVASVGANAPGGRA